MSKYPEFDTTTIKTQAFAERASVVSISSAAGRPAPGATFAQFFDSLPAILAGQDIRTASSAIAAARLAGRSVVACCGGHVVKCGLAPVLIDLMERGVITALAVNGAVAIHDAEMALFGSTSENVDSTLGTGMFGMCSDTAAFLNGAILLAKAGELGAGEAVGRALLARDARSGAHSLLAAGARLGIPVTMHVAIGTDIIHMHPSADGGALGEASLRDFRIFAAAVRGISNGGVLINIGSAVVLPEVSLKALSLLRNEDPDFGHFLGIDMDFSRQYRATQQIVRRASILGGRGIALTGHHEIMLPLLAFAVVEACERVSKAS